MPPKVSRPCSNLSSVENIVYNFDILSLKSLETYRFYLKEHLDFITYRMDRAIKCSEEIERRASKFLCAPEKLTDLINLMNERRPIGENQCHTLETLRREESQFMLLKYVENTSTVRRTANVAGTFYIRAGLGMDAKAGSEAEREYEVKLYKHGMNEKGSFWCNCPENKFNSKKKDIVCKHICFIVCKAANILDVEYFQSKQLTQEQFDAVMKVGEILALPE